MTKKEKSLKFLIDAYENQKTMGNLTEKGKEYLNGLKSAYKLIYKKL